MRKILSFWAVLCLAALPVPAFANHGLNALGALVPIFFTVLVIFGFDLVLSIGNLWWKKKSITITTIILTIPLAVVSFYLVSVTPIGMVIVLALVALIGLGTKK